MWSPVNEIIVIEVVICNRPWPAWYIAARFDDSPQMLMAVAATAANNVDTEFGNEIA